MIQQTSFPNRGVTLSAHLHLPDGFREDAKYPALVGVHPAGGVKEQTIGLYAQRLAAQGFVVVVYDSTYQGASGGEPRLLEDPSMRVEDARCAADSLRYSVATCCQNADIDPILFGRRAAGVSPLIGRTAPCAASLSRRAGFAIGARPAARRITVLPQLSGQGPQPDLERPGRQLTVAVESRKRRLDQFPLHFP